MALNGHVCGGAPHPKGHASADWSLLLRLWQACNEHLANVMSRIPESRAAIPCMVAENPLVTLAFLVEDYIAHMRHRQGQLGR